jgi:hypothetical protein
MPGSLLSDETSEPSPLVRAAEQILLQAEQIRIPDNLAWDPLTWSYGGQQGLVAEPVTIPEELILSLVNPAIMGACSSDVFRPSPVQVPAPVPMTPTQIRALKKLQQRREAAAAKVIEQVPEETPVTVDESWIDQLERKTAKEKEGKEKAAAIRKQRKNAQKSKRAKQMEAAQAEQEEEDIEAEAEGEEVHCEPEASPAVEESLPAAEQAEDLAEIVQPEELAPAPVRKNRKKGKNRSAAQKEVAIALSQQDTDPSSPLGHSSISCKSPTAGPTDTTGEPCDHTSDMGMSDVSTSCPESTLRRQQTAPPTAHFASLMPSFDKKNDTNIMLRVKGTFVEAVQINSDVSEEPLRRSWSDGDLLQLQQVFESESEAEI